MSPSHCGCCSMLIGTCMASFFNINSGSLVHPHVRHNQHC
jgi:hypothetical protein